MKAIVSGFATDEVAGAGAAADEPDAFPLLVMDVVWKLSIS